MFCVLVFVCVTECVCVCVCLCVCVCVCVCLRGLGAYDCAVAEPQRALRFCLTPPHPTPPHPTQPALYTHPLHSPPLHLPSQVIVRTKPRHWYHFLTTTCAIIGGVFTVAGIIDALLYNTLKLAKKVCVWGRGWGAALYYY